MKKRILFLVLSLYAAGLFFGEFSSLAQDREVLKQLMRQNYAGVTSIVSNLLLDQNYDEMIESAELIRAHAGQLLTLNPKKSRLDRETFNIYADILKDHAENLAAIVRRIKNEKGTEGDSTSFLRPTAASHFGQVLTACVTCHNHLREW